MKNRRGYIFATFIVIAITVFSFVISTYFTVEDKRNMPDVMTVERNTGETQIISQRITTKNKERKYSECIVPIYRVLNEKYPKDYIRTVEDDCVEEDDGSSEVEEI